MTITLYCVTCGGSRILSTDQRHRSGCAPLTCFRCGEESFTADVRRVPIWPTGWVVTLHDQRFLRSLRIAPGAVTTHA